MIKAITIDFWNTLFDSSGGAVRNDIRRTALLEEIARHDKIISESSFDAALRASWEHFNGIWRNEMRTPDVSESVKFFWGFLELPQDTKAINTLVDVFAESVLMHPPKMLEAAAENLEKLSKNYKIGLVSDTGFSPGTVLRQLLKDSSIFQYFDAFSFSDETGVSKPHKRAFETVLSSLSIPAENAVHIGDIEATDVIGAKSCGMKAIRFSGDPTAVFAKENTADTKADYEIRHWNEIEAALNHINSI